MGSYARTESYDLSSCHPFRIGTFVADPWNKTCRNSSTVLVLLAFNRSRLCLLPLADFRLNYHIFTRQLNCFCGWRTLKDKQSHLLTFLTFFVKLLSAIGCRRLTATHTSSAEDFWRKFTDRKISRGKKMKRATFDADRSSLNEILAERTRPRGEKSNMEAARFR